MTITINGMTVTIFKGACVRDAVRKLSPALLCQLDTNAAQIMDSHGNRVQLDGALVGGEQFFTKSLGGDA